MKNMVRILTGTLVEVGLGRMPVAKVATLIAAGAERKNAGPTAPALGLTLVEMTLGRGALAAPVTGMIPADGAALEKPQPAARALQRDP